MAENKPKDQPEDIEELARRYVDLWQDQMTALAADPEFAESLQKLMAGMGSAASGLPGLWAAWPAAMTTMMAAARPDLGQPANPAGKPTGEEESNGKPAGRSTGKQASPSIGTTSSAAAPDGGGPDLGDLEERLAAVEQRLLALERGGRHSRGRAAGKAKRS